MVPIESVKVAEVANNRDSVLFGVDGIYVSVPLLLFFLRIKRGLCLVNVSTATSWIGS